MNKDDHISEEQLNAFIDGELDSEEKSCLFAEAEQSAELDQRLCQQRKLKELVKHAYLDVPEPAGHLGSQRLPKSVPGMAAAASILLLFGIATGLFVSSYFNQGPLPEGQIANSNLQAVTDIENYILHVVSGEPEKMKLTLQKARELLSLAEPNKPRRVEIVANEQGLNLLRSDMTPFSEEISALANDDVIFYACSKAIERLEEKGVEVRLVPEAVSNYTALDRVVSRMKDGWHYVKI